MKEEKILMKLELQNENQKLEKVSISGIKLYFFKFIYFLLQKDMENNFLDYLLIIGQFIQLMAFPLDSIFSSGWKTLWFGTVGKFFHYIQLIFIFIDHGDFYIISFIVSFLYIIIFTLLIFFAMHRISISSIRPKKLFEILSLIIRYNTILCIPFLKILFSIFSCDDNGYLINNNNIKCNESIHIGMIIISIICIIIYFILLILLKMTFFEFGVIYDKLKASFTSSTEVLLIMTKFLLVIIYQFIKHKMAICIITLIISIFIFFDYYGMQPFTNGNLNKTYFILYLLFLWTCLICFIGLILQDSKFEGTVLVLLLGYPFITLAIVIRDLDFTFEKIYQYIGDRYKNGYKKLLEIEFFLKLEESLYDEIRTREQKLLYSYINNYERTCTDEQCGLKSFLKIPLKPQNFSDMRICLLQHAEVLYRNALAKYPFYVKLRLSYALFLYKKVNKKQQGTNEVLLLNKYSTNFEDTFLIFRAQKLIEDENIGNSIDDINSKTISPIIFKAILNNIKNTMGKIAMNYIDFWTILSRGEETNHDNFKRMNKIGNRISKLNNDLIYDIERLERANLYDQDTIKLYSQYLIDILNDQESANKYNSKLIELEQAKHQYNEDNIFNMNFKAMSRSEEYKYIVISCSPGNFGIICNMSLSVNVLFGFTKEELVGRPLDYILPELFIIPHKKLLQEKVDKFKKSIILKNNTTSKIHSESRLIETFGRTKMKYLVPIKMKIVLVSSEDGKKYGVSKIITENYTINDIEQEVAYVLTDKDFVINSFTPNSTKLLNLQMNLTHLNLDITNYIHEMRREIYLYEENNANNANDLKEIKNEDGKEGESNIKRKATVRTNLVRKSYINENTKENGKKLITWNIYDIYGKAPHKRRLSKNIRQDLKEQFNNYNKNLEEESGFGQNIFKKNSASKSRMKSDIKYLKDENEDKMGSDISTKRSQFEFKKNAIHKFYLNINEIKMGEAKIGYIFKFEPKNNNNNTMDYSLNTISGISQNNLKSKVPQKNDFSEIEKSNFSSISFSPINVPKKSDTKKIIFNKTQENPGGIDLGLDTTFIPKLLKENRFYLDAERLSYKQISKFEKDKNYKLSDKILREEAEKKISEFEKNENEEEEEEESEELSYTYSSEEENEGHISREISSSLESGNDKTSKKSKNENGNIIDNSPISKNSMNISINNNVIAKNAEEKKTTIKSNFLSLAKIGQQALTKTKEISNNDFYHINSEKITLFVYNYATGFVEAIKDPKFKISQVTKQIEVHREKIGKSNAKYIANPKLAHKEKKKNLLNSLKKSNITENEISSLSEKKIKLIEIEKALKSKEKQKSIINLCIVSFVVFGLIIGSSVVNLLANILLKSRTYNYYYLVEKSVTLYKNVLFEIFFVREIVLISNENYTNIYEKDKDSYFKNYSSTCYDYYLETSIIISKLSTNINTLSEKAKEKIINKKGSLSIIYSINNHYDYKNYPLLIYSAFHEINSALYHISQMKKEEVDENERNIFYFLRNGLNFMLKMVNEQIDIIIEEFDEEIKTDHYYIIACIFLVIIIYIINYIIFVIFYQKVENRKQSYLSIFEQIGKEYIFDSLDRCEKFSKKIHIQDDFVGQQIENASNEYSSIKDEEENGKTTELASTGSMKKIKEIKQIVAVKEKKEKVTTYSKEKIIGFIILFVLLLVQIFVYYYYYIRLNLYQKCVQYEYYNNQYYSLFLFPFIIMREYIFQSNISIMETDLNDFLENTLNYYYMNLNEISENRDKYAKFLPSSYTEYLEDLYNNKQCSFVESFIKDYHGPDDNFTSCESFFYNMSHYGFEAITMTFIEDIRIMKDLAESILYSNNNDTYKDTHLMDIFQSDNHKNNVIIYRFVIMEVIGYSLNHLFKSVRENFDETKRISLITNIVFMVIVFVGFSALWIPFVLGENETIYKTKNMLSIIPKELLINLPDINSMLGIDIDS